MSGDVQWPAWMGPTPRINAPWSGEEEQVLTDRFRSGQSIRDIAYAHGRAEGGIRSRLAKLGLITEYIEHADVQELRAETVALRRDVDMLKRTVWGNRSRWRG
jgi:hypothetical protein